MNATLEILEASRQEVKNIIKDIQQNSDHANDYDLMGIYEDIRRLERENVSTDGIGSTDIGELKGVDSIEEFERKGIIKLCKMNKNELLTLKTIVGTIFDIAISSK